MLPGISLEKHAEFCKTTTLVLNIIMTPYYNKHQFQEIICNEYYNDTELK